MDPLSNDLLTQAIPLVEVYFLPLVEAFALLVLGWIISVWARRGTLRGLERLRRTDRTVNLILASLVRYVILAITFVAVLAQAGVQTASILALLGTAGLAIGLALQGTLSNVAAGIMLLLLRPFKIGDFIDAEGVSGRVDEIGLFSTYMTDFTGVYRIVPNTRLWNSQIMNFSTHATRRVEIVVTLPPGADFALLRERLLRFAANDGRVLESPAPNLIITGFTTTQNGAVQLVVALQLWVEAANYLALLIEAGKRFDQALHTISPGDAEKPQGAKAQTEKPQEKRLQVGKKPTAAKKPVDKAGT